MLQLKLLLEKLYHHKSDLELMIHIHEIHNYGTCANLNDQYSICLKNIAVYEITLEEYMNDLPLEESQN